MLSQKKPGNMMSRMLEKKRKQLLTLQANNEDGVEIIDIKMPTLRRLMSDQSKDIFKTEVLDEDLEESFGNIPNNKYSNTEGEELGFSCMEVDTEDFQIENKFSCSFCPYTASSLDILEDHLRLHSRGSSSQSNSSNDISCKEPKTDESVLHFEGLSIGNHFLAEERNDMNSERDLANDFFQDPVLKKSATNRLNNYLRMDIPFPIKLEKDFEKEFNEKDIMDIANAEERDDTAPIFNTGTSLGFLKIHADEVKFVKIEKNSLNLKRINCRFCSYSTNKKFHLHRHLSSHFRLQTYKCLECSYGTYRKDHLERHRLVHSKNKPLKCFECKFGTDDSDTLIHHIEKHLERRLYSCNKCQFKSYSKEEYKTHLKSCGVPHFLCSLCDYVSLKKDILKRHMKNHCFDKKKLK